MCWSADEGYSTDTTVKTNALFRVLPKGGHDTKITSNSANAATWKVVDAGRTNTSTSIRCTDNKLCPDAYELYKIPTEPSAANPFKILQVDRGGNTRISTILQDIKQSDSKYATQIDPVWNTSVSLHDEEVECGLVGRSGQKESQYATCSCTNDAFTPWVDDPYQPPELNNCGECMTKKETFSHPLQTIGMSFLRAIALRAKLRMSDSAGVRVVQRRNITSRTGCERFANNPAEYLMRYRDSDCKICPRDCTFKALTAASLAQAYTYSPPTCPTSKQQCKALKTSICIFDRHIDDLEANGGRTCQQVHLADMHEIARLDRLQRFKEIPTAASPNSDRTV